MSEFPAFVNITDISGKDGFVINGDYGGFGWSVSSADDVNGDGLLDLVIGSPFLDRAYVLYGKEGGYHTTIEATSFSGSLGFMIENSDDQPFDQGRATGFSLSSAGDFNGDGNTDLIIGAPDFDDQAGRAFVVFGQAGGFKSPLDLSDLKAGEGFAITGHTTGGDFGGDQLGISVASAGDLNGDGFSDVIIGATYADTGSHENSGAAYVVFGTASVVPASFSVDVLDGSNGFLIKGLDAGDILGQVASAGDINGDGFDDIIIGAHHASHGTEIQVGESYVVFGRATGFAAEIDLSELDGSNGFRINGAQIAYSFGVEFGASVSSAGDVNGDGFDDIVIGAPSINITRSSAYSQGGGFIVYGKASGFAAVLDIRDIDGNNGFSFSGQFERQYAGADVSSAGDFNGDGFDDILIGTDSDYRGPGSAFIVFGKADRREQNVDLSKLDGSDGIKFSTSEDGDYAGRSVSAAGDLNGDGFDDIIIGAENGHDYSGRAYIVYGHRAEEAVSRVGTTLDNTINGGKGADQILGLAGNDHLIGWEKDDEIAGGQGKDRLSGRSGNDTLIGGLDRDQLIGGFGADTFDFNAVNHSKPSAADVIWDFGKGHDHIDLSDMGHLSYIGTNDFNDTGQVRIEQTGADVQVEINLADNNTLEMLIVLKGVNAGDIDKDDFILL